MEEVLKWLRRMLPFYARLRNRAGRSRQLRQLQTWERSGRPIPPPHIIKQRVLKEYARQYQLRVLVETGTYRGDMVEALRDSFDRIYSIELSRKYFERAKERFRSARHIELICGDSGEELGHLVQKLSEPALFWLDGHYSAGTTARGAKDTPVVEELQQILNSHEKRHVVIIDDARCFGTDPGYPTFDELMQFIRSNDSDMEITIVDDSIRITPRTSDMKLPP